MTRLNRKLIFLAACLSFLAGYMDALGFLSLHGFFVSFMSGNSTRLGVGLAHGSIASITMAFSLIGLFIVGVILGSIVGHLSERRRKESVLLLVTGFLFAAALCFDAGFPHVSTLLLVIAMGAENDVFAQNGEVSIGLTYMTGTLVKMGQRISESFWGGSRFAWCPYALLWIGLVLGAFTGTKVYSQITLNGLWFGVAFSLLLTFAFAFSRISTVQKRLFRKSHEVV
jgi:uncharacterized membrane protein YoaK (UPF0700 family)